MMRVMLALVLTALSAAAQNDMKTTATFDPVSRCAHLSYEVPAEAPETVTVTVTDASGQPLPVMPLISETALNMTPSEAWKSWREGVVVERRAAGLARTVVLNPYPALVEDGAVDAEIRVQVAGNDGAVLTSLSERITHDAGDVVVVDDWSNLTNANVLNESGGWTWPTESPEATFGEDLRGPGGGNCELPQLSYPLDLTGWYAIYVVTPPGQGIDLRLTGDERSDRLVSPRPGQEVLWRWAKMDRQHLVLSQPHAYTGWVAAGIDYVKWVPLTVEQVHTLDEAFGERDKMVAGYFEPYSWAFHDHITETLQHRMPLTAYVEARIGLVDVQVNRFGMKSVYETRRSDQLLYSTIGDPIGHVARPTTDNVGRMQQFTNTLDAEIRYAKELGLVAHANFGASNCYPGSPLQGDFSKEHPEWMRGSQLRFEVPEVQEYALRMYREALEIGAPGVSLDFCRYPETIDVPETANAFLRDLRVLTNELAEERGEKVPVLVRFPGTGVRLAERFDYATWAREGLVDYLCPSNIQGRHMHIDMAPYLDAVQGTDTVLLPELDGLGWALPLPGPFLWRARQVYDQGAPGIYVYQADARVLGTPGDRRTMRLLASHSGIDAYWAREEAARPSRSKGIYITTPHEVSGYHGYERIRIWTEGIPMGPVEVYLDDELVGRMESPPYLVGSEDRGSDGVIPPGPHTLRIRAQDGDGWLEQTFDIQGAG